MRIAWPGCSWDRVSLTTLLQREASAPGCRRVCEKATVRQPVSQVARSALRRCMLQVGAIGKISGNAIIVRAKTISVSGRPILR